MTESHSNRSQTSIPKFHIADLVVWTSLDAWPHVKVVKSKVPVTENKDLNGQTAPRHFMSAF